MTIKKPAGALVGNPRAEMRDAHWRARAFEHIQFTLTDSYCQAESVSVAPPREVWCWLTLPAARATIGLKHLVTQLIRGTDAQFISGRAWFISGVMSTSLREK